MLYPEILSQLESMGTAQNRKIYQRHGSGGEVWGVSFADLKKLKLQIIGPKGTRGVDHGLAVKLWRSKNVDCQTLAGMIADPLRVTSGQLDSWVTRIRYYPVSDYLAKLAIQSPYWKEKIHLWTTSKKEYVRRTGYTILALAAISKEELRDVYFKEFLNTIVDQIHTSPNRARESMNQALIAIGIRNDHLKELAVRAAEKIGNVEVDHGETSCRSYNAAHEILRIHDRQNSKSQKIL